MSGIAVLALNDLRLTLRDRPAFFWLVLLPVAMMWIFGGLGSQRPLPRVGLGLDDRDRGWVARALVEELRDGGILLSDPATRAEGQAAPPRTLVIPDGFTAAVLAGRPRTLRLEHVPGSNEEFGFAAEVQLTRAIVRTLGRLAEMGQAARTSDMGDGAAALQRFRELAQREPLVRVGASIAGAGRPVPGGLAQSVPGALTFTVLMMVSIYGAVFLTLEKRGGVLRRQAAAPLTPATLLLGKLAGRLLIAGLQIAVLLSAGRFVFGISWGASPAGLVLLASSFALAVAGLAVLLGAVLSTPAQASIVGWSVAMVQAALGGCWWPSEVMPGWLRTVSHALPTAWAMDGFHALISFGRGAEAVIVPSLVLAGFGLLFTALGARLLRFEA